MPLEEVGMKDTFDRKLEAVTGRFGGERERLQTSKRPISEIVREILVHLEEIVRSEMRLARTEIGGEIGKAARQSVKPAIAAVLFLYAFGFLLLGAVYGLAEIMPVWLAALVVGGALAGIAAIFWQTGRRNLSQIRPRLDVTTQTLKEDFSWIKKQNS
jgi:hypothetical protein